MHSSSSNTLATVHGAWETLVTSFLSGTMNALWNTHQSATEVVTDQLDPATNKNVAQQISSITEVGTGTGGTPSPRNAVVIGLRTALPTRAGRGRMYWPSPDQSHYTNVGQLNSSDAATIANGFGTALSTFKATSLPIVYHRKLFTFDAVTNVTVGNVLGSQRRRTNKDPQTYENHVV